MTSAQTSPGTSPSSHTVISDADSHPRQPLPPAPAWLDEIEGSQALAWVEEHNAATRAHFEGNELCDTIRQELEQILSSPDKIPTVTQVAGYLYNFWTDAQHPRGLWRRTTWESYREGGPCGGGKTEWEILLDLDALGAQEGVTWVWHGASVVRSGPLAGRRALISLSDGGSDTDVTREFDLDEGRFLTPDEGGFYRAPSKGWMVWADEEASSVLVGACWDETSQEGTDEPTPSLTASGYPRQIRRLRRGQQPNEGEILLTVPRSWIAVWGHRDLEGRVWLSGSPRFFAEQAWLLPQEAEGITACQASHHLWECEEPVAASGAIAIDVPHSAELSPAWDQLCVHLRLPWRVGETTYPAGSLLALPVDSIVGGQREIRVLFSPTASTFLQGWTRTRQHLVLSLTDDVVTRLEVLTPNLDWQRHELDLSLLGGDDTHATTDGEQGEEGQATASDLSALRPGRPLLAISAAAVDGRSSDQIWLTVSSFTQPTALFLGELSDAGELGNSEILRQSPPRFDASGIEVTQHVAISDDGTRVPYFQVGKRTGQPVPTILYGYGGFEVSLGVSYQATTGKGWLERGGTYVLANLRGGGEYGPAWHEAGLKENRHRIYEDCAAVARSLIERGVARPEQLAVHGGSNGGLLVGNMLTQYPQLFGAVICEVPLLDMKRYTHLLAGASWEAEYGDPDDPAQWEFIQTFSPFHLLKADATYPPVLFITSTRDDRVHPAHARTMAYRMDALGQDVTYFENSEGGHGRASTDSQKAWMGALSFAFAWEKLSGQSAH